MKGWNARNLEAMRQFTDRSDFGMNLSGRIWQSCRQLRDEMEVALTVAIGEGEDAGTISRRVRQYLKDPDLMFRRFRYKDKDGQWQKKWKKRVKDPDHPGRYKFVDCDRDTYRTGRGVYKSAAKNAMRVARTETNIAYRRADHERWQGLDFVLGQRVVMSRSHPQEDICDKLSAPNLAEYEPDDRRGLYPKDFVFDGWHPQCFCFVIPVMVAPEEMAKMNEAFVRGEDYTPKGEPVTEYPEEFKTWCRANALKIEEAQSRGTEPYFIRNNAKAVEGIINPQKAKQLTIAEKAKLRHDARTEEEIADIQRRWDARLKENAQIKATANNVLDVAKVRFSDFDIDTSALTDALQSGRIDDINTEMRLLAKKLSIKQQNIKLAAKNVARVAGNYKDLDGCDLIQKLQDSVQSGNLLEINKRTKTLAKEIGRIRTNLKSLSVYDDVFEEAKKYTFGALQETENDIIFRLNNLWSKKYGYADYLSADPSHLKAKLEWEIANESSKYKNFPLAQRVLKQKIAWAEDKIYWDNIQAKMGDMQQYYGLHKKSTTLAAFIKELDKAITGKDKNAATKAISEFDVKKKQLEAAAAKRKAKKNALLSFDIEDSKPDGVVLIQETKKQSGHLTGDRAYYENNADKASNIVLNQTNVMQQSIKQFALTDYGKVFGSDLDIFKSQTSFADIEKEFKSIEKKYAKDHKSECKGLKILLDNIKEECIMQARAVGNFSYQWDYEIRQIQCGNSIISRHGHTIAQITERAESLERFIRCSPRWDGGVTYRGMTLSGKELDNLILELKAGRGDMLGSASWSTKESVSQSFAGSNTHKISTKYGDLKDKKVVLVANGHELATSIKHLSKFSSENEVLGSVIERFEFIKREDKGEYIYIYVKPS